MKRILYLTGLCLAFGLVCPAAPCVSGSLASYIALGSAGCTIGGDTLSNFKVLSGSAGATEISASAVTITPLGGTFNPGISAAVNLKASAGTTLETMFTYSISGVSYLSDSITLSNASETADGGVTDIQNFCEGGTFGANGVTGCAGLTGSLLTLDGIQNQNSTTLPRPVFLNLTDDFTLAGGLAGTASGGTITDQLTGVPEPAPLLITAFGLAFVIVSNSRFVSKSRFRRAARCRGKGGNA